MLKIHYPVKNLFYGYSSQQQQTLLEVKCKSWWKPVFSMQLWAYKNMLGGKMDSVSLTSLKLFGPVFSNEGGLELLRLITNKTPKF